MKLPCLLSTEWYYVKFIKMEQLYDKLQLYTEKYLTYRKIKKAERKEKQKNANQILDWIKSFLWAAMVVLLINQYFFQAYQIPTGSMMNTLLVKDHLFVNKLIYGPELIPGKFKLPGFAKPERGDILIFESPTYLSKGPVFDIAQRIIYMVTLSMVDIDKDSYGEPKAHFLIKRSVGAAGDRIRFINGNMEIRPAGAPEWMKEADFVQLNCNPAKTIRLVSQETYPEIRKAGYAGAFYDYGFPLTEKDKELFRKLDSTEVDSIAFSEYRQEMHHALNPADSGRRASWRKSMYGWYIPEGWIFPLGENRDNSRDGRFFGPVSEKKVLGKASFIYWPAGRAGSIE